MFEPNKRESHKKGAAPGGCSTTKAKECQLLRGNNMYYQCVIFIPTKYVRGCVGP